MNTNQLGYSVPGYAAPMNISPRKVYYEIREGRLEACKIGSRTIITIEQADKHRALLNTEAQQRAA